MMPIGGEQIQWSEDKVQPLKEIKDKIEKSTVNSYLPYPLEAVQQGFTKYQNLEQR